MKVTRKVRLKTVWFLVIPFLWFASPTPRTLAIGGAIAFMGLIVRSLSAGFIHKESTLTTTGPYAHTRNPLYVGTFMLGIGVTVAGGSWPFVLVFLAFFAWVYTATIRKEAELLSEMYGEAYAEYAANVPLFVPRPTPYRFPGVNSQPEFSFERWSGNKEYEAWLGALAGFAALFVRMIAG